MFNPSVNGASKVSANKKAISDVTKWVVESSTKNNVFTVDQFQVMVTEIQCNEPDCVPIETLVIIVLMDSVDGPTTIREGAQKWANKIMMPVAEVSREDVVDLINEIFPSKHNDRSDDTVLIDTKRKIELFEEDLSALITKYQLVESTEDATSYKLQFIQTLQTQIDILRRDITKVEAPVPTPAIPVPEPVRAVTTVIMKPNHTKLATLSAPVPDVTTTGVANSVLVSVPISVPAVVVADTSIPAVNAVPSSATDSSTTVTMNTTTTQPTTTPTPVITYTQPVPVTGATIAPRHKKGGTRPRGCPCCDPDNLDNIIDSMMFSHYPQT